MAKKKTQYLVIHCTATPQGREVTADDIREWHTSSVSEGGRGWKQVGYSDLIQLSGKIEQLVKNNDDAYVDGWEITNGAAGVNSISRHIVYAGGLATDGVTPKDTRTNGQLNAMIQFVHKFHNQHPDVKIIGHNELAKKACPSFDVQAWLKSIGINQ